MNNDDNLKIGFDFPNKSGVIVIAKEEEGVTLKEVFNIEFGQVIGSIGWAREVAREEGGVYHRLFGNEKVRSHNGNLFFDDDNRQLVLSGVLFDGWHRKIKTKTNMESFLDELEDELVTFPDGTFDIDTIKEVIKKYEVKKIE